MKPPPRPHPGSAALPFGAPQHPADVYTAHVDGAARGNPGPASYAVIVRAPDGTTAWQMGKYIGRTTNNVAEYYGLIAALDYATAQGIARLRVISDSELMVKQMKGQYRVKSPDLQPLYERAKKLSRGLAFFAIEHVRRAHNADADALANVALDRTSSSGYSPAGSSTPAAPAAPGSILRSTSGVSIAPDRTSPSGVSVAPGSTALSTPGNTLDRPIPTAVSSGAETATSSTARPVTSPRRSSSAAAQARSSSDEDDARLARVAAAAARSSHATREGGAPREQRVKARYANGALHPLVPLDLTEGETVELRIRKK